MFGRPHALSESLRLQRYPVVELCPTQTDRINAKAFCEKLFFSGIHKHGGGVLGLISLAFVGFCL